MQHVLVLGGQRSGKSAFAEQLVLESGLDPVYLATAEAGDGEMADRIRQHRDRRGDRWVTIEEPLELASVLAEAATPGRFVLVDCLTLWLSNLLAAERMPDDETSGLIACLGRVSGPVALVSNEVGSGVIPDNRLARQFVDALGVLNQQVAHAVDRIVLMTAGLPLTLKPATQPEVHP